MVMEYRCAVPSEYEAICSIAGKSGIGSAETLRNGVRRAEVDAGRRPGTTSEGHAENLRLKKRVVELERANAILKTVAYAGIRGRTLA